MKFTDETLSAVTALNAEQAAKAAQIAPKLRMLHNRRTGRASVISFLPEGARGCARRMRRGGI